MTGELHRKLTETERDLIGRRRLSHGPVLGMREQMVDAEGRIGAPLIALATLAVMERNGTISPQQRTAGERFHVLFRRACLDGLKAAAMDRVSSAYSGTDRHSGNERARKDIAGAISRLGGQPAITASCAWHVLGLEWSLTQWAAHATRGNTHQASGVMIATLAILDAHFGD